MTHDRLLIFDEPIPPGELRIEIADGPEPAASDAVRAIWEAQRAERPRLFNGPVLSFDSIGNRVITARRESYRRLVAQESEPAIVDPPVIQLSVTGVITAVDIAGVRHVLVGKRSQATRIYGSMWELAPAGGVDPPPRSERSLDGFDVYRQLVTELAEEVGLPADPDPGPILALAIDGTAMSCDIVMRLDLARPLEDIVAQTESGGKTYGWEYDAVRWLPVGSLGGFAETQRCIPPTAALLPWLDTGLVR
ncbi:MAG: hypothetical protein AAGF47_11980 [Planctomycetota bacterium]